MADMGWDRHGDVDAGGVQGYTMWTEFLGREWCGRRRTGWGRQAGDGCGGADAGGGVGAAMQTQLLGREQHGNGMEGRQGQGSSQQGSGRISTEPNSVLLFPLTCTQSMS